MMHYQCCRRLHRRNSCEDGIDNGGGPPNEGYMEPRVRTLEDKVETLSADVLIVKADVVTLKEDVSVLKSDVSVLKADVSVLKSDVSVLKSDVSVLKTDVSMLKADVAVIKENFSTKADVAEIRADISDAIIASNRWNHAALIGMFGAFVLGAIGLLFTIWNTSKAPDQAVASQSHAPIVIQVPSAASLSGPSTAR